MSEDDPRELPDHDFLSKLVRDDPKGYERLRRELIANLIDAAPERLKPRLRGMQFRIDSQHELSRSPLGLTISIYNDMWETFLKLNDSLHGFNRSESEAHPALSSRPIAPSKHHSQVLEFRRRPKARNDVPAEPESLAEPLVNPLIE